MATPVPAATPLLEIAGLKTHFPLGGQGLLGSLKRHRPVVHAVDGVDVTIERGETLGLIGESGSGKTTLGRTLLRLYEPTAGTIRFDDTDVLALKPEAARQMRRRMQMVFQNPYSAVNRRKRLRDIIIEPMRVHGIGDQDSRHQRANELLELVGLPRSHGSRYPHEVSGGQLQRIGIARALSTEPDFIVADEPTASLDVSVRAQVMNLLKDLKAELGLTMLFISHDLSVVSYLSDRIAVMYLGRVVEIGQRDLLERDAQHPYTQALLGAVPRPDPRARRAYEAPLGEIPSPVNPPSGCHYHGRCPLAMPICKVEYPPLEEKRSGQLAACHAVLAGESEPILHPEAGSEGVHQERVATHRDLA